MSGRKPAFASSAAADPRERHSWPHGVLRSAVASGHAEVAARCWRVRQVQWQATTGSGPSGAVRRVAFGVYAQRVTRRHQVGRAKSSQPPSTETNPQFKVETAQVEPGLPAGGDPNRRSRPGPPFYAGRPIRRGEIMPQLCQFLQHRAGRGAINPSRQRKGQFHHAVRRKSAPACRKECRFRHRRAAHRVRAGTSHND